MKTTHTDDFVFHGVLPRNTRRSWSGRSADGADGADVAVTLRQDGFEEQGRIHRSWQSDRPGEWRSRPGFVELIENLAYARDRLYGRVHVILAVARDKDAVPRSIERSFVQPRLKMRVTELDEREGTFVPERLDEVPPATEQAR